MTKTISKPDEIIEAESFLYPCLWEYCFTENISVDVYRVDVIPGNNGNYNEDELIIRVFWHGNPENDTINFKMRRSLLIPYVHPYEAQEKFKAALGDAKFVGTDDGALISEEEVIKIGKALTGTLEPK